MTSLIKETFFTVLFAPVIITKELIGWLSGIIGLLIMASPFIIMYYVVKFIIFVIA